jgi:two-component system response regulator AtoC
MMDFLDMGAASQAVLIVDDDPAIVKVLGSILAQDGIASVSAESGERALEIMDERAVDVVVSDLRMPGMDGLTLLERLTSRWSEVPVIILTAHGTVQSAVEAMKGGAADFLLKPFDREEVLFVVRKALARAENEQRSTLPPNDSLGLLGKSETMSSVRDRIRRAAGGNSTVLIRGETGTGKELVARAVHQSSPRRSASFVKLNCAAVPDSLLESELFGYEKGAFTGAASRKPGRVELAHGGTLFLDEIGDVPLPTQVKLLRILQEREIERLGGTQTLKVDVRFIAATHRDLEGMVRAGEFREDLFYRLNVVPIEVPPLRERQDDIADLAQHFARAAAEANGRPPVDLEPLAVELLAAQRWPGNVRQLENFLERLLVFSDGPRIRLSDVERELGREAARERPPISTRDAEPKLGRKDAEREAIREALQRAGNNRSLAARLLGVSRRTLYNKLQELDVS